MNPQTPGGPESPGKTPRYLRRGVLIAANLVLYFFLVRWVINNIDVDRFFDAFSRIPPGAVAITVLGNLAILTLYGLRMSRLMEQRFAIALTVVNLGYALNALLPFRIGDVTKIYLGRRLFGIRISRMVSATFAEKLFDFASLAILGSLILIFSSNRFVNAGILAPLVLLVVVVVCGILAFRILLPRLIFWVPKRAGLRRGVIGLHRQLRSYKSITVHLTTIGIWCLSVGLCLFSFNAYIAGLRLGVFDAMSILLISALTIAVPSAPAGIGLYEAGIVAYLQQRHGVGAEAALASATMFHLAVSLPQLVLAGLLVSLTAKKAPQA